MTNASTVYADLFAFDHSITIAHSHSMAVLNNALLTIDGFNGTPAINTFYQSSSSLTPAIQSLTVNSIDAACNRDGTNGGSAVIRGSPHPARPLFYSPLANLRVWSRLPECRLDELFAINSFLLSAVWLRFKLRIPSIQR